MKKKEPISKEQSDLIELSNDFAASIHENRSLPPDEFYMTDGVSMAYWSKGRFHGGFKLDDLPFIVVSDLI